MKPLLYLREFIKQEKVNHYLSGLKKTERYTENELKEFQFKKLNDLLQYLLQYNPFYSEYIKVNEIHLDGDWQNNPYNLLKKFPITDKLYIKKHYKKLLNINTDYSKVPQLLTSGSTGSPFQFYQSSANRDTKTACKARLLSWHGIKRGEKQFFYGGKSISHSKLASFKIRVNNKYFLNLVSIDSTKLTHNNIAQEIERINREKPVTIYGYPSTMYDISKYSILNNLPIQNEKLKMVILSGESSSDYLKEIVHQAFHIKADDEYCSVEGYIACTCECHQLHLNEDTLIAEIQNSNGEITEYGKGELIVTYLYSYDFPFIRYSTGDLVEISDEICECGRSFKVLNTVDGRKGSYVSNGETKITDAALNTYITATKYIDVIDKYQVVQNDQSSVIVKLVVSENDLDLNEFEIHLKNLFDKLEVNLEYVDQIPKDKSGKYRVVINNVPQV